MTLLGALVYVNSQRKRARDAGLAYGYVEAIGDYCTGVFAGLVFSLCATWYQAPQPVPLISASLGACMGSMGLTALGNRLLKIVDNGRGDNG